MIAHLTQQIILWSCAVLLLWAAVSDLRTYIIPNSICFTLIALYPIYIVAGLLGGASVDWAGGVLAAAVIFSLGFALFCFGLMGGGDVKLFSAVALWTGLTALPLLFVVVGVAGGVLSLAIVGARTATLMRLPPDLRAVAYPNGRKGVLRAAMQVSAPYGVAIAIGGFFIIYRLLGLRLL